MASQVEEEYKKGTDLLAQQQNAKALAAFEEANRLAGGKCFACLEAMAAVDISLGQHGDAIVAASEAIKAAEGDEELARAYNQLGLAYAGKAQPGSRELSESEQALRKALELSGGRLNAARYNLAMVLIREGRAKEADKLLEKYLQREPAGEQADQARALKRHPRRATETPAPAFTLRTLDGDTITLQSLEGKVVLLDFWATWCGPCLTALPDLKDLRKRFSGRSFEIISISADRDRRVLEDFIKKNDMTWPQFFDERYHVSYDLFNVRSYPSYFVLDPEGIIVYSTKGYHPSTGLRLASEILKALEKSEARRTAAMPLR